MSPPEIWGPPVWRLFHTLAEKINENSYPILSRSLFHIIVRICKYLPCPECSSDASNFLAKINPENLKTKDSFKKMLYLFHNYVNSKKRKGLFNYSNINVYKNYKLGPIVNHFISVYNTRGNMKLLSESFQRQFVIKEFKFWLTSNISHFYNSKLDINDEKNNTLVSQTNNNDNDDDNEKQDNEKQDNFQDKEPQKTFQDQETQTDDENL